MKLHGILRKPHSSSLGKDYNQQKGRLRNHSLSRDENVKNIQETQKVKFRLSQELCFLR